MQVAQSPWPLWTLVGPSCSFGMMWSVCLIGASQYGVLQVWSRNWMKRRCASGKQRRRDSMAIRSPLPGRVNRRRSQARVEPLIRSRADWAGIGP